MLTPEEVMKTVELLGKLDPGSYLPAPVFHALERLAALTAIENVFLRENQGKIEVLLTPRPSLKEDPYYGGQVNSPGSMLRGSDVPSLPDAYNLCDSESMGDTAKYEKVFRRILKDELGVTKFGSKPKLMGTFLYLTPRGLEHVVAHLCTVREEDTPNGTWYCVGSLPENLVKHHREVLIPAAVEFYKSEMCAR